MRKVFGGKRGDCNERSNEEDKRKTPALRIYEGSLYIINNCSSISPFNKLFTIHRLNSSTNSQKSFIGE